MRNLLFCCLLVLPVAGQALAAPPDADQAPVQGARQPTEAVSEADAYLAKIDASLALASSGQYGTLRRGWEQRVQAARNRIGKILDGRDTVGDLPLEDRLAIRNAEDVITSTLRNNDKDRIVCRREAQTGTRLASAECMTVAEREARAAAAAAGTATAQRLVCYPGEGQSCK